MLFSDSYLILVLLFGSVAQWRLVVGLHSREMPRCCDVDLFDQCCHVDNRLAVSRRVHEGVAEDVHSSQRHSGSEVHAQSGQCIWNHSTFYVFIVFSFNSIHFRSVPQKIAHRDVKSPNLLVSSDLTQVKWVSFLDARRVLLSL